MKLTINADQLHFRAMRANAARHAGRYHRSGFEVGLDSVRALANLAGQVPWDEMLPKKQHICPPADGAKRRFGLQDANSNGISAISESIGWEFGFIIVLILSMVSVNMFVAVICDTFGAVIEDEGIKVR